eukprot:352231-Chlamydomonas_euryale.AAC.4
MALAHLDCLRNLGCTFRCLPGPLARVELAAAVLPLQHFHRLCTFPCLPGPLARVELAAAVVAPRAPGSARVRHTA